LQAILLRKMKIITIIGALILALGVSANDDKCCNYTNGGKCIMHCPGRGRAGYGSLAEQPMIRPIDPLSTSEEKTETKENDGLDE
jgi:hypothetical protein